MSARPPPTAWSIQNVTYVEVGLKLDVEPQIFPGNEIGLKVALEVSSINSTVENKTSGLVAYRIGTRNASTVLRLKDGENQVLAGPDPGQRPQIGQQGAAAGRHSDSGPAVPFG